MGLRKEGKIPFTLFFDTLKDARVSKEKLFKPGSTRVFSVAPVETTWTFKKYFGHFQAAYYASKIDNEAAMGIDADSLDWTRILRKLVEVEGQNFITGDYKAFGDTLSTQAMYWAFEIIVRWYEHHYPQNENQDLRRLLAHELLHPHHLAGNTVYRMYCGIPSGFPLTVELNSLVNCLYMRYVWKVGTKRPLSDFNRYVRLLVYGDDLVINVADKVKDQFDFFTVQRTLASHNVIFTDSSKQSRDSSKKFESLHEITFLKRSFVKHPSRANFWLGPLPEQSIYEMLNWTQNNVDYISSGLENSRASLNCAYGRGPVFYEALRKKLRKYWADVQIPGTVFNSLSWQERDREIFDN